MKTKHFILIIGLFILGALITGCTEQTQVNDVLLTKINDKKNQDIAITGQEDITIKGDEPVIEPEHIENAFEISLANLDVKQGATFTIPVLTNLLSKDDNIIAYQFNLSFNANKLEYSGYGQLKTLSEGGMIAVNAQENGLIRVAYANISSLFGEGSIIDFNFKALSLGETDIILSDFKYNTTNILNINNSTITISNNDN